MGFEGYNGSVRFEACKMLGEKYNEKYGPLVLVWFTERELNSKKRRWYHRYTVFSEAFDREIPQTSLYRILGYMAMDGILEMRTDGSGRHSFRLNTNILPVIAAAAEFLEKRG